MRIPVSSRSIIGRCFDEIRLGGVMLTIRKFIMTPKRICPLLIAATVLLLSGCFRSLYAPIISENELKSYSVPELKEVLIRNMEEFTLVGDIVLSNEGLAAVMEYSKVVWIDDECRKSLFTEEEWNSIVELFRKTGLNRIERISKTGTELVRFLYRTYDTVTSLYYCPNGGEEDLYVYVLTEDAFEKAAVNWWAAYKADRVQ